MRPSLFQAQLGAQLRRCDVCSWCCTLAPGDAGRCRVRRHHGDTIACETDGLVSAALIGPIEDHRLWHFFPDTHAFSVGSFGTPLVAQPATPYTVAPPGGARELAPERVADFAQQRLCRDVVWAYNDPAVTLEWTLDGLKLARAGSRFTALVSSGFFSAKRSWRLVPTSTAYGLTCWDGRIGPNLELGGLRNWQSNLEGAAWLRTHWNTHIEVYVPLYAGINDAEREIEGLARCTWRPATARQTYKAL